MAIIISMRISSYFIVVFLSITWSCRGKADNNSSAEFFGPDNLLILKTEGDVMPDLEVTDYFSLDRIINLESTDNSLLNNHLDKVVLYREKLYVLDSHIGKGLYVFDMDGKFINRIVEEKDGPLQMTMIKDFVIDPVNEEIQLLDMVVQKIFRFSLDGRYISDFKTPVDTYRFELIGDKHVFHPVKNSDSEDGFYLHLTSSADSSVRGFFPYLGNRNGQFTMSNRISVFKDRINLWEPFNDTIYQLHSSGESFKYFVDFGGSGIGKDIWNMSLSDKITFVESLKGDRSLLIGNVVTTDKFLYFNYISAVGYNNVLYDYSTGRKKVFHQFDARGKSFNKLFSLASDDYLYAVFNEGDSDQDVVKVEPGDNPAVVLFKLRK